MRKIWFSLLSGLLMSFIAVNLAFAQDPTGAKTLEANPEAHVDYVWVLVCGFLVMFMQAGFAMVEAGFCRAKNATNLMAKNMIDYVIAGLCFMMFGYALMKGADFKGLFGTTGWFLLGEARDVGKYLDFFWQLVFCGTAATIVSGAVAERLKFPAYLIYTAFISKIIYPNLWSLGLGRRLALKTSFWFRAFRFCWLRSCAYHRRNGGFGWSNLFRTKIWSI